MVLLLCTDPVRKFMNAGPTNRVGKRIEFPALFRRGHKGLGEDGGSGKNILRTENKWCTLLLMAGGTGRGGKSRTFAGTPGKAVLSAFRI
jgi:hypothetical protein